MQEEGNNAFGCNAGCVMSILPLIIFMGLFYALSSPLTNMLHLDAASVSNAVNFINTVPATCSQARRAATRARTGRSI